MYKIINTDLSEEDQILTQTFVTGQISSRFKVDFLNRNNGRAVILPDIEYMLAGEPLNIEEIHDGYHVTATGIGVKPNAISGHIAKFVQYCEQNNFSL